MTTRQKIIKTVYPLFLWLNRIIGKSKTMINMNTIPPVSFYSLTIQLGNGETLDFASLKGKKVLLVNTASDCGFTPQYDALQELYDKYQSKLVVIGFPANDFGEQEKADDVEIEKFCRKNFGVSFPLAKKSTVVAGPQQNPVFAWLSQSKQNGWNDQQPAWNFAKYLVNENGMLTHYFASSVTPLGFPIMNAIQ
jgi:glutathione peroxidase